MNNPARTAIIPRLIEPAMLPAANILNTTAWSVSLTAGPLLGAALVAAADFGAAYTVDVVLFSAALWALWRLPPFPPIQLRIAGRAIASAGWRRSSRGCATWPRGRTSG